MQFKGHCEAKPFLTHGCLAWWAVQHHEDLKNTDQGTVQATTLSPLQHPEPEFYPVPSVPKAIALPIKLKEIFTRSTSKGYLNLLWMDKLLI